MSGLVCCGLILVVFILAINVLGNFGKGLKDLKFDTEKPDTENAFDNLDEGYIQFEDDDDDNNEYNIMDVIRNTNALRAKK